MLQKASRQRRLTRVLEKMQIVAAGRATNESGERYVLIADYRVVADCAEEIDMVIPYFSARDQTWFAEQMRRTAATLQNSD